MPPQTGPVPEKNRHEFDAKTDAHTVEALVQHYLEAIGDTKHPAAALVNSKAAEKELMDLITPIWRDLDQRKALAVELEKLGGANLSTDPNVDVNINDGEITGLTFKRSFWNFAAANDTVSIDIVSPKQSGDNKNNFLEFKDDPDKQ